MDEVSAAEQPRELGVDAGLRLVIGLAQGLALYLLYEALDSKTWPATNGLVFAPLSLIATFVPLLLIQGIGNLRAATLLFWAVVATAVIAGLGWYDIWSAWPTDASATADARVLPSAGFAFFLAAGLFIAHALILGGDADRRFMARYPTHFDVAWKLGVQFALSVIFVALFWLVLWLGASLFGLIKLEFFRKLIEHRWFAIPATTLAVAAALHITDMRAGLVRGIRTLVLVLLSWLLPVLTLIATGFLVSLIFTGLDPLWQTRLASGILLAASAWLVVLINATYQDGEAERRAPVFLRTALRLASLLLIPTVMLAAYALHLRVQQYGWTADRIATAACALVAASYAIGYALAAFRPDAGIIARWNFGTSLLILVILGALFSPLADPARISVASQVARLQSGAVKPQAFDFTYLRWHGGRYGHQTLTALAAPDSPKAVRDPATTALNANSYYTPPADKTVAATLASRLTAYPKGRAIPQSFLATKWDDDPSSSRNPACVTSLNYHCDLVFADLDGDGRDEIVLLTDYQDVVYRDTGGGVWRIAATFDPPYACGDQIRDALRAGKFALVDPAQRLKDFVVLGVRLHSNDARQMVAEACPK